MTRPHTSLVRLLPVALTVTVLSGAGLGCEQDSTIGAPGDTWTLGDAESGDTGAADDTASSTDTGDTGDTDAPSDTGPDTSPDADGPSDTGIADTGTDTGDDRDTGMMDTDTGPQTYPADDVEAFWDSHQALAVRIRCRRITDASCRGYREPPMPGVPTRAICENRLNKVASYGPAQGRYALKKAVTSGRQTFDKQAARACINKMKQELSDATACSHFWGEGNTVFSFNSRFDDNPCERVLRPTRDKGESCLDRSDCKAGLWCDEDARADKCGGTCVPLGKEGESCDLSRLECVSGLDCVDGTCQKNPPKGVGQTCSSDSDCKDDLNCESQPGDDKRCRSPKGPGQTCSFGDCQSDHDCVVDPSDPNGSKEICVAEDAITAGQPCTDDDICKPGLLCHNNTCRKVNRNGRGQSCDGVLDFCKVGLACRPTSGGNGRQCAVFGDAGDPCVDSACKPGLYCKNGGSGTGTCRPTVAEGKNCERGGCKGMLYCVAGTCIDRARPGARCNQKLCEKGVRCTYYDNNNVCGGISSRCSL